MIAQTLSFLAQTLDTHMRQTSRTGEPVVRLETPAVKDSDLEDEIENRLLMTLVNLERESVARNTAQTVQTKNGQSSKVSQPLNLNLVFLLSARFPKKYETGLSALSSAVAFFQSNPVFTPQSSPILPAGLKRLTVEWRDMDLQATHNLWTAMNSAYQPCAVYKARMLVVEQSGTGSPVDRITKIGTGVT